MTSADVLGSLPELIRAGFMVAVVVVFGVGVLVGKAVAS